MFLLFLLHVTTADYLVTVSPGYAFHYCCIACFACLGYSCLSLLFNQQLSAFLHWFLVLLLFYRAVLLFFYSAPLADMLVTSSIILRGLQIPCYYYYYYYYISTGTQKLSCEKQACNLETELLGFWLGYGKGLVHAESGMFRMHRHFVIKPKNL